MARAVALLLSSIFALPLTFQTASAQTQKTLTVKAIYGGESLAGQPPDQLTWSPDGRHLTYIEDGELMDIDSGSGKSHVLVSRQKMASLDQTGGSERDRDHRSRYAMASYIWAPDSQHLLFDSDGQIWIYDLRKGRGLDVGATGEASGDDPKFAPDGSAISFVGEHGLSVIPLGKPGTPVIAVAPSSDPAILNGAVDWVYEEELETRSNYFWSPDSKRLAYLQMDETNVPQYPLTDWIPTHAKVYMQRYPQPGDPNPAVRVGVVSARGGKTVWIKLPLVAGQDYVPRFGWAGADTLWIETLTRNHQHRDIYLADAATGEAHRALEISDEKFLDDNYDVTVGSGWIVLTNWSSGYNQIYLYSYDAANPAAPAQLVRPLTSGDFAVGDVYQVDFQNKTVDYASNEGDPLQQQLWQVNFEGKRIRLSSGAGYHKGNFAPAGAAYVDTYSTLMHPPTVSVCASQDKCEVVWQTHALDAYHLPAPEQLTVKAHDGTTLYATLLLPAGVTSPASVPLIVNPYGGPGVQTVDDRWGGNSLLFDELLAQHGFAVLHADNRGMAGRGRAFAQAAYHDFGPVQLEDQLTVVDAVLARYPQLDRKRLGWWGWSWGGTFTLYAMTHSDRFRAGVSVAPVTDWRNYDSIYTERYMGLPAEDSAAYHDDSVVNSAAHLKGRLLLVHGTGDDNVHIENTVQFVQQLIEAQLPYDLQIYPRKTHSIAGPDVRTHLFTRILAQFEQYLMPPVQ